MNHEEFERLAAMHHEGLSSPQEQHLLDEHVRSCPKCLDRVEQQASPASERGEEEEQRRELAADNRRRPFFRWWLGAAALFFLALFGWSELRLRVQNEELLELQANVDRLTTENARLFRGETHGVTAASVLCGEQTVVLPMASAELPEASARAFIDPESHRAYFFVRGLRQGEPAGKYHLWTIPRDASTPRRLAVFDTSDRGEAAVGIEGLPDINSVAGIFVTLEPVSAATAPAGKPLLTGKF